jgi:hypothetical protein
MGWKRSVKDTAITKIGHFERKQFRLAINGAFGTRGYMGQLRANVVDRLWSKNEANYHH